MNAAIIGGGIMGISLGYYLSRQGVNVEIFEASPILGGLAGPLTLDDGTEVDRFYHAILSSDNHLRELCEELGIADQLRFNETRMGFFYQGEIHSMNNILEFFRFPPLGWVDRFRLGLTVLVAQFIKDWHALEKISVKEWLVRWSGQNTYQNIWRPLLKAKFDGGFDDVPATYIWSRLVRMKSTRGGANQKEESGHLIGGYIVLINEMVRHIQANGGRINLNSSVQEILIEGSAATGVRIGGDECIYDVVVSTVQSPIFSRLIQGADPVYVDFLNRSDYLGIIVPLLVLDKPLSGYWTLNITDDKIPFTGVIETTSYIDPEFVGGHHLVYLPKYTAPGSPLQRKTDDEIREIWIGYLEEMFPDFDRSWIRYFLVNREKFVEPLHGIGETDLIPGIETPVKNLYLATTSQIYPTLTNGESVTRHARQASEIIMNTTKRSPQHVVME